MARSKDLKKYYENPCKYKGRYGGDDYQGQQFFFKGQVVKVEGCECNQSFIPHGKATYFKNFAASKDFKEIRSFTTSAPKDSIQVVPCKEIFKTSGSKGTRAYKKQVDTKFTGCASNEKFLIENEMLAPLPIEADQRMKLFSELSRDELSENDLRLHSFYHSVGGTFGANVNFSGLMHNFGRYKTPPKNIQHSMLRKFFLSTEYNGDSDLKITAFLIDRGISLEKDKTQIAHIFPHYPTGEISSLQSKVFAAARKEVPEVFSALSTAMEKLTANQKKAMEAVYLEREIGETLDEVAKKLKITRSSLKNRIEGAKKKIIKALTPFYDADTIERAEKNISRLSV